MVTLTIYAHVLPGMQEGAAATFGRLLAGMDADAGCGYRVGIALGPRTQRGPVREPALACKVARVPPSGFEPPLPP
jgi:hypothetical protein